jgi:Tol biopolymer transport system component
MTENRSHHSSHGGLAVLIGLATALATILWIIVPAEATSLTTELVSISSGGAQGNEGSFSLIHPISPDGRFVVFGSFATNIVPGDTNGVLDIFRHDRSTGQTIRASVSSNGDQANGESDFAVVSGDGNLVAFHSIATNLVPGDTNRDIDVFVRDVSAGVTTRISVTSSGKHVPGGSFVPSISDDGRFVAFESDARLVPEDTNRSRDAYVHDLVTGETSRVSVSSQGQQGNDGSFEPRLSPDGRFVTFGSDATNLVPGPDTNDELDVFLHDRLTGQTIKISVSSSGQEGNGVSVGGPISNGGRFVAFFSEATNLVPNDTNGFADIFIRDVHTGKTKLISLSSSGEQGNDEVGSFDMSANGRFLAYRSFASNLVPGDGNGVPDIFLTDRETGQTVRASVSATGAEANDLSGNAGISGDGRWVVFVSTATNLVDADTNGFLDTFVRGPFGN